MTTIWVVRRQGVNLLPPPPLLFSLWRVAKRYQSICTSNTYLWRSEWGHNWTGSSSVWLGGTQETGAVSHTARWLWCSTTCRT